MRGRNGGGSVGVYVEDVHRGLLRRGARSVDSDVAGGELGLGPDLRLFLGEAFIDRLALELLTGRDALGVHTSWAFGRRDALIEYVVHAPVVERVLWLQLIVAHDRDASPRADRNQWASVPWRWVPRRMHLTRPPLRSIPQQLTFGGL